MEESSRLRWTDSTEDDITGMGPLELWGGASAQQEGAGKFFKLCEMFNNPRQDIHIHSSTEDYAEQIAWLWLCRDSLSSSILSTLSFSRLRSLSTSLMAASWVIWFKAECLQLLFRLLFESLDAVAVSLSERLQFCVVMMTEALFQLLMER
ncbi:hypothetical protein EYF80_033676 [Liparis tanakae]|uniref:Uncharacterized protein n=1 Tax=Liparis tanakae TaxID=230148 RepID=A0A4Z2GRM3_9TELE|nr:hypothetical protein EYF80_033676 [Liparis tanakae]